MHILHALFTHVQGGLGQAHVNTTEALIAKGHQVTALMHPDSPYCGAVTALGAQLVTIKPTGFYDVFAVWKMRRLLKQLRPDIIVAHNSRAIALLSLAAKGTGIAVCGVSHSYKTARTKRADSLVVLSEHMRQNFIRGGYTKHIDVIPNFIHLPEMPSMPAFRKPVVIGSIGRFTPEKGFDDLICALGELKQMGVAFVARLGCDGEERAKLEALSKKLGLTDCLHFDGWIKDAKAFYKELDIFCLPSLEESFPLVILEALAYGVPIVATDTPGPITMLSDNVTGVLVPRGDVKAMAKALQRLATQPDMAARMAEAGWQRVQSYGFSAVADLWDAALKNLISDGDPSKR